MSSRVLLALLAAAVVHGDTKKLSQDQRMDLIRGLTAEFATAKVVLPRSKKPLPFNSDGTWDQKKWEEARRTGGPAAKVGDMVKITKVSVDDDSITFQLNDGMRKKGSFWDRVQIDMGGVSQGPKQQQTGPDNGTTIVLRFKESIGDVNAIQVKKLLAPVLDFEKRSASENFLETLPAPIQQAVKEKKAVEGMDQDTVIIAMGRPLRKTRETKDEVEQETWQYGEPPGRVTFVTFAGQKVVQVKDTYAGLGGSVAQFPVPDR